MKNLLFCFCLVFLYGCASTLISLKPDQIKSIKTIAILTDPVKDSPQILDHTKVREKSYGGYMFGAVGGLIEGMVLNSEAQAAIKLSLGADPKEFLNENKNFRIKNFDAMLSEKLETAFTVIPSEGLRENCKSSNCGVKDYLKIANEKGADAFVYLKFTYGLAAYLDRPGSVAIDGDLIIYQIPSNKILLKKSISSEEVFIEPHKLVEFIADDSDLFKQDIQKAVEGTALVIASEWHLFQDEIKNVKIALGNRDDPFGKNGISTDYLSMMQVSCSRPVKLEQDCSGFAGAKKRIKIDSIRTSIAGSKDGKVVLVMYGDPTQMVERIKKVADRNQIQIEQATRFGFNNKTEGYILYTNGDLYSLLSDFGY